MLLPRLLLSIYRNHIRRRKIIAIEFEHNLNLHQNYQKEMNELSNI